MLREFTKDSGDLRNHPMLGWVTFANLEVENPNGFERLKFLRCFTVSFSLRKGPASFLQRFETRGKIGDAKGRKKV